MKKNNLKQIGEKIFIAYLYFAMAFVLFALGINLFFTYLSLSGQDEKSIEITNNIDRRIDGRFQDNPNNIWYDGNNK
jgi:hypothetical protein